MFKHPKKLSTELDDSPVLLLRWHRKLKLNYANRKRIISSTTIYSIANCKGFTLVETMIVMLISAIVLGAIFLAYRGQLRSSNAQEQIVETQQNIRAGLSVMGREIRMAGFDPGKSAGAGFTTATANSMAFTLVADNDGTDNDNDGTTDEPDELQTVWYDLYDAFGDGDLDLGRRDGPSGGIPPTPPPRRAVSEDIDAIEFFYTMDDGTQTTAPVELSDIRSVQISILSRTSNPDMEYINNLTYIPASGNAGWDLNGVTAGTGNPPNDNFRRRLLITTIVCRNMGL